MAALITLLSDFGLRDPYVGVMKGVILAINPEVHFVDLTHEVASYDILDGALALAQSYAFFPPGTIHLGVVDPGVGSERRPVLVSTTAAHFVGPDNGVFELVYRRETAREVRHITNEDYFRKPVSRTFHGRDIFAPVAGWLSAGVDPERFGSPINDYVRLDVPRPRRVDATVRGSVLRADKFGNLITNFSVGDLPSGKNFRMSISGRSVIRLVNSYASGAPGEVFAILGSTGFVEIAARQASAAEILGADAGTEITLTTA